jgi:hypothetical protein
MWYDFLTSKELDIHEINVHIDKLYQCQSCYKILSNADEFNEHIKSVHNTSSPSLSSSFEYGSSTANNKISNDAAQEGSESTLVKQTSKLEKARRRMHDPYRKSHQ